MTSKTDFISFQVANIQQLSLSKAKRFLALPLPHVSFVSETRYFPLLDPLHSCLRYFAAKDYEWISSSSSLPSSIDSLPMASGAALLVRKPHQVISTFSDFSDSLPELHCLQHRVVRATVILQHGSSSTTVDLISVYAPTYKPHNKSFITAFTTYLTLFPPSHPLIIGGDWNAVTLVGDGTSPCIPSRELINLLDEHSLKDAFVHLKEPGKGSTPSYVYTNTQRNNNRRIDALMVSSEVVPHLVSSERLPKVSSHHRIQFNLDYTSAKINKASVSFRYPGYAFNKRLVVERVTRWAAEYLSDMKNSWNSDILQINFKRYIQGRVQTDISLSHAKSLRLQAQDKPALAQEFADAAFLYRNPKDAYCPSDDNMNASKARAGKRITKDHIVSFYDGNKILTEPADLLDHSQSYFRKMFEASSSVEEVASSFHERIPPSAILSKETSIPLEGKFTEAELKKVIFKRKTGSSPGPDGFPYEFYQVYYDVLKDHLLELFNSLSDTSPPDPRLNTASIRIIPKGKSDRSLISNWRPISLINTDMKLFAHLINARLAACLPQMVHPDQTGFVNGRYVSTNLDTLDQHFYSGGDWTIGTIDFRKAFDTVSHKYIIDTLTAFGVGPIMIGRIIAIQTNANSAVRVNQDLSETFDLGAGVRQGCPLSPFLFALSLEPLLIGLRHHLDGLSRLPPDFPLDVSFPAPVKSSASGPPIQRHTPPSKLKVAAYADDMVIFMNNEEDLKMTGVLLKQFGQASCLQINPSKTVIQHVSSTLPKGTPLQASFQAVLDSHWENTPSTGCVGDIFKYLGIHFGDPTDIKTFYDKWFDALCEDIRRYPLFGLETRGRAWSLATFIFSKLIYVIPYTSITMKQLQFIVNLACKKINGQITKNITPVTHSQKKLLSPSALGGFGLLNLTTFVPNLRLIRAFRILRGHSHASNDLRTQFFNQSPESRLCHNLIVDRTSYTGPPKRAAKSTSFSWAEHNPTVATRSSSTTEPAIWSPKDYWTKASSPSFGTAMATLAEALVKAGAERKPWTNLHLTRHSPASALYTPRARVRIGYPSKDETNALISLLEPMEIPPFLPPRNATAPLCRTPDALKHLWKKDLPLLWPKNWEAAFRDAFEGQKAEVQWRKTCGSLFQFYGFDSKAAEFIHLLLLNQIAVTGPAFEGKPFELFKYNTPGCSICKHPDTQELSFSELRLHILCKCPTIDRIMAEIKSPVTRPPDLLTYAWVYSRSTATSRLGLAIWKIERGLRISGASAEDPTTRGLMGDYIRFITRGGRFQTFTIFSASLN